MKYFKLKFLFEFIVKYLLVKNLFFEESKVFKVVFGVFRSQIHPTPEAIPRRNVSGGGCIAD